MVIKVSKYIKGPNRKRLKNKYIVYDTTTMRPLSGIAGTSRSSAYKISKKLKSR